MAGDNETIKSDEYSVDDYLVDDYSVDEFTLESILAEYKGSAFIEGDKRTPPEILNEQTERIIKEVLGDDPDSESLLSSISSILNETPNIEAEQGMAGTGAVAGDASIQTPVDSRSQAAPQTAARRGAAQARAQSELPTKAPDAAVAPRPALDASSASDGTNPRVTYLNSPDFRLGSPEDRKDSVLLFFENYSSDDTEARDSTIIAEVERAVEREIAYDSDFIESDQLYAGTLDRTEAPADGFIDSEVENEEDYDELYEEPDLREALRRFSEDYVSITYRIVPSVLITLIMIMLTLVTEAGMVVPFGVGRNHTIATGALIILLLFVMMLCIDIIVRGAGDLLRGAPNVETLILFSCALSIISGAFAMLRGSTEILPYCAISAASLAMAAWGERLSLQAMMETLKTAILSSEPFGLQAEFNNEIDKSVLKKAFNRLDGFYSNLVHPDISETAYRYAAPILLAAALVLSVLNVVLKGEGEYFLHTLSALLAAAAPFSAMLTFSFPFGIIAKSIRKHGAAIAGWGGVDDICFTDGACVTDDDLFPPGTLSFNGVKLYGGISPEIAIGYTGSMIIASGSGLSRIFDEVMKSQKIDAVKVEDFNCREGGIGARINDDIVIAGSAAYMDLQGIRISDDMNMKNAVFTAINNKLAAFFAVEYKPLNSVQLALLSMLKWRVKLYFAMRDFNITPKMLEQRYRIDLEGIEYIQTKDSYILSDSYSGKRGRMAALLSQEGLGPFAETITSGRLLKTAAQIATTVSVVSAALGVLFLAFVFWNGSYSSAKPGNLLIFMLCNLVAVLVICGYVRSKK